MRIFLLIAIPIAAISAALVFWKTGSHTGHSHGTSEYVGQESRRIKSLSDSDILDIQAGAGWGLAKVAELNGVPGPAHVLELQDKIELSDDQKEQIELLFDQMKAEAIQNGEKYIEIERILDDRFKTAVPDSKELEALVTQAGAVRAQLRFVHLNAHLKTVNVLSKEQIETYNSLRGYSSTDSDPCKNIPTGHSEAMWKKHNGCE